MTTVPIHESNIAMLGSDLEKKVRKDASDKEPAWSTAGKQAGVEIWRVEKFKIVAWPKDRYGQFLNGDSYIVLKTIKNNDKVSYDVHFWLGQHTTQDEAGTAAYKTVELDDHLGTLPTQHREVQGHESQLFLSYFPHLQILDGGIETGFHHYTAPEYKKRLYQLVGAHGRDVRIVEIPLSPDSVSGGDAFILDGGTVIYQWTGQKANPFEKAKAANFVFSLENERVHVPVKHLEQGQGGPDEAEFFQALGGQANHKVRDDPHPDIIKHVQTTRGTPLHTQVPKTLHVIKETDGQIHHHKVATGNDVKRNLLKSDDAFLLDAGDHVWVWIGKGASLKERKYALTYAHHYLEKHQRPFTLPISRVIEGNEGDFFLRSFHH